MAVGRIPDSLHTPLPLGTMATIAYKVRIDTDEDDSVATAALKKWLVKYKVHSSYFVREHISKDGVKSNFHQHGFVLFDKAHKTQTLRKALKKGVFGHLPDSAISNGNYSFTVLKAEGPIETPFEQYLNYLSKGADVGTLPDVVSDLSSSATFTPEWIDSAHRSYWSVAQDLKKRKLRMYDDGLDRAKRKKLERREEIASLMYDMYLEAEKPMNPSTMRGITNLIYAKVCPDKETARFVIVDMIMERRDIGR